MNAVFTSSDDENRARLLSIIHDFLESEVEKKGMKRAFHLSQ